MRTALTALLAFAAGILLMLVLSHYAPPGELAGTGPTGTKITARSNPASAASVADAAHGDVDGDAMGSDWPLQGLSPEQVIYAQPQLLHHAIEQLSPRVLNKPNLYVVAFAGDGGEDVFHNEAEYTSKLFAGRFGATAHTLVLENHPTTLSTRPLATWSNLENALDSLSSVMKPDEDILMLYLTTHGDEEHNLLIDMDPLPLDQIGAADLAEIFKKHPFRWKVVVVNACYSGGFVPTLRGPNTLVMTAARTDRSSFGCGSDSDITYFGKAWLTYALNRTPDFIEAFKQASGQIAQWEQKDQLVPSEPQIDVGTGIAEQLAQWRKSITPGPAVPFTPAKPMQHPGANTP
ncbi:C13 family peptidase [Dyella tabacisoli]|uniref:Peptidase C13 n=1 Tax=Dyella tabacisoli TaxID=2282381 RepID=A0A369URP9_9GAMM|nr:C13 family peptidase [Dyella tabacisoli]RDD83336.1 peptidase C13 [Dyella tabacisoli]